MGLPACEMEGGRSDVASFCDMQHGELLTQLSSDLALGH